MTEIRIGQLDLRDLSTSDLGSANAVANLESNIVSVATTVNAAIDTVSANADTLTTLLNTVSGNIDAAASLVSTISGNADTFASLVTSFASYGNTNFAEGTYIDGEVANLIASAPTALNTLQELATAINNDAAFFDTITGLADTVNANTASIASNIDGIQSNLDSYATYANSQFGSSSNISLTVGNTTISNSTIFVEGARSSVYANTNTTSKTLTFTHTMGNATSQEFTMNGSTNALTLGSTATSNTNMYFVFYNGLALKPDEYSVSGSTMTLANVDPIISGSNVEVRYLDFFGFREESPDPIVLGFQGENFGYASGGYQPSPPNGNKTTIEKYSFTSDASSTSVGSLTVARSGIAGQSSSTHGYATFGSDGGSGPAWPRTMDKFPFASDTNASSIGTASGPPRQSVAGASSDTHGYGAGGWKYDPSFTYYFHNNVDKFPFASDTDGVDVLDLSQGRGHATGVSSTENGYVAGGRINEPGSLTTNIDKFPFASDTNASDVAEIGSNLKDASGNNSYENGYLGGGATGHTTSTRVANIRKFPFSSDSPAVGIGQLSQTYGSGSGTSSSTSGYAADSDAVIDKFPFSSDAPGSNIGSLVSSRYGHSGQQY